METLGIKDYEKKPEGHDTNQIKLDTFVKEAYVFYLNIHFFPISKPSHFRKKKLNKVNATFKAK